ncbi:hypothetical protein SNOG_10598 [Parastagonospora nodorum SN15]|uniref:Uncharacterized protein n=1 Tax=Phaeosphaeria nodorum (strain SN15 / ATCC MYA-4574 / FGSC 10173) TaxID=321614 RepID=Q0UCB6_PHANO|nr:hypothetical protein SNOG_10598 [Parastagonospora nodorum SN15]EAT81992.2 hypothetical protein SNOG_10598 [Parastagonospora nodorum SN15]
MYYTNWTLDAKEKTVALQERTDVTHHVEGGMGNIIRRIIDDEGQSVTAASELEKVVPRFFKARGEPAQPTTAWALVMRGRQKRNKDIKTKRILGKNILKSEKGKNMHEALWDRLWQSNPPQWSTYVSTAIAEGASLHRVLSGGGGWGKKAGLLSLDPVPVSEEVPIRMEDATSGFEGPGDFSTALTPVVRDGDAIQFFIAPAPASEVDGDKALENLKSLPKQRAPGWELGVIPSTVDSFPGGSWQHVGADSEYIAVFRNSFGALSEGGLTLTRRRGQNRRDPLYPFGTTTIDAPYSRLWSVELADKEISNNDFIVILSCPERCGFTWFLSKSGDGNGPEMETSIAEKPVANLQQEQTAREKHRPGVLRQRQRVVTFSEFLHRTSSTMDENKHLADGSLLDGSGVVLSLERQVNDLDASTSALRNDLRTALAALDQLEWIIRAANKNAFQIYSIHLTLRLRLLTMVRSRQRRADRPGRAPFYMHIPLLEAHIAQLQAFDEVLFAPGTNTTSEQIRKSLSEQVHQHPVQQYLTRRAWLQTARNITNASQQASSKLKIRHHLTYAGESKAETTSCQSCAHKAALRIASARQEVREYPAATKEQQ